MKSINLLLVKILVLLFKHLPFRLVYAISNGLFLMLYHVFRYRKNVVKKNLSNSFPRKSKHEVDSLTKGYYHHLCDLIVESVKGLSMPKEELQQRFVFKNPEIFPPYSSAILLGSHFGNWEWGVLSFPLSVEHTVLGIYKPLSNKFLNDYLSQLRKQWGLHLAPMSKAGRAMIEYMSQPTILVLIADQTPSDVENAHWLNFLNQDTPFLHGADKLARRTGLPVFYFEIEKKERGQYEVTFVKIREADENLKPMDVTRRFASQLEKTIHKAPVYWLWSHKRWKRKRPN